MKRFFFASVVPLAYIALSLGYVPAAKGGAIDMLPGCTTDTLPANDDGSTGAVPLPFTPNFFGTQYAFLYVNNNGNVTFNFPLFTYTPEPIGVSTTLPIIAPFWGDVDTRGTDSGVVQYGATTFDGRAAFCVLWDGVGVGYYDYEVDKLNKFQLLLVDRSDVGVGDFDIIFNYDQVQWETGDASGGIDGLGGSSARVGYASGALGSGNVVSFELPGSGANGAFLDSNPGGLIYGSRDSLVLGRYVFPVRNGAAPTAGTVSGTVFGGAANPGNELFGAPVQVCDTGDVCHVTQTDSTGQYAVPGLSAGDYLLKVFPPSGTVYLPTSSGPVTLAQGQTLSGQDFVLLGPTPPPPQTGIEPSSTGGGGVPVIYWEDATTLTAVGCAGGTASYVLTLDEGYMQSGPMTEGPPGVYKAILPPFYPHHGTGQVTITIVCPDGTSTIVTFDLYVDPSGIVQDTTGQPVGSAIVTLFRSDSGTTGSFTQVPDGSPIMSPANQTNPDVTNAIGQFGWDVIAGYYVVRAEKTGCKDPDSSAPYVETPVIQVPPEVIDLSLVLECSCNVPGATCDDGDACTVDTCDAASGTCSHTPVTCTASDQCHVAGTCDSATGICSNPAAPNGTPCNDGDACTTRDQCTSGTCAGAPVVCTASDQCHVAGTCDSATATCSNPAAPNGTSCNDGNPNTVNDVCTGGVCAGTASGPTNKEECKNGGWQHFAFPRTFKNQGDCIQFVNTGK